MPVPVAIIRISVYNLGISKVEFSMWYFSTSFLDELKVSSTSSENNPIQMSLFSLICVSFFTINLQSLK